MQSKAAKAKATKKKIVATGLGALTVAMYAVYGSGKVLPGQAKKEDGDDEDKKDDKENGENGENENNTSVSGTSDVNTGKTGEELVEEQVNTKK